MNLLAETKNITIICLLIVFIFSCSKDDILPEDKFIKIYIDILVAQDTLTDNSISNDSLKTLILQKYNVADSIYTKTIEYYNYNPDKWENFFEDAIKQVEELKATKEQ
ncbi:MAG: DUF4296 domain-containing protein [Bacteroidetes bacterium]|nr:DUF4296 domain-containing protein [Bacteroidota bacterium]